MAFVSIKSFKQGWSGTDSTVVKQFTVTMDDMNDDASTVTEAEGEGEAEGVPKVDDQLSAGSQYVILSGGISVSRIDEGALQWRLTATYTKTGFSFSSGDDSERLISFGTATRAYTETAMQAWESYNAATGVREHTSAGETPGIDIKNSSGDFFDPSDLQVEYYNTIVNFTQRENRNFDYVSAINEQGSINKKATTILGMSIAAGKGLLRLVNPVLNTDSNGDFEWSCSYSVELAGDNTFWSLILDRGFYATIWVNGAWKKKEIMNSDMLANRGEPWNQVDAETAASEPQPLDGQGKLASWNSGTETYAQHYLEFRNKKYSDWEKTLNMISQQIRTG